MSQDGEFFFDAAGVDFSRGDCNCDSDCSVTALPVEFAHQQTRGTRSALPFYFDLETVPDEARIDSFDLDPVPPVPDEADASACPDPDVVVKGTSEQIKSTLRGMVPPGDWLDRVAAAETAAKNRSGVHSEIERARSTRLAAMQAHEDRIKLLSVTPEYCSIAAMGWTIGSDPIRSLVVGETLHTGHVVDERYILGAFWANLDLARPIVGFNCLTFDLPVIFVRSAILGVDSSRVIDMRPWGDDVVDVFAKRFGKLGPSNGQPRKLKSLAPLYDVPIPAEDVDGSQVYELMRDGRIEEVGEYVRSDVHLTRSLHCKLAGYFWS